MQAEYTAYDYDDDDSRSEAGGAPNDFRVVLFCCTSMKHALQRLENMLLQFPTKRTLGCLRVNRQDKGGPIFTLLYRNNSGINETVRTVVPTVSAASSH